MKRQKSANLIITFLILLFIISGLFSTALISGIGHAVVRFITSDDKMHERLESFITAVDSSSTYLSYEGLCKDIYSYKTANFDKKRIIEVNGSTVVRLDNDYLNGISEYISDTELQRYAKSVGKLCAKSNKEGADFLYVAVPTKGLDGGFPDGVYSYVSENMDRYLNFLNEENIPLLNLKEKMQEQEITEEDAYFVTDHHWKPETAFWAFGEICQELDNKYGLSYNKEFTDLKNYSVEVYKDWYLGSQGCRAGQYFTPLGIDDISLITPKFDTSLKVTNSRTGEFREGNFKNSVIFEEKIEKKDLYNRRKSPYAAYSGGDFAIQEIKNMYAAQDAPKILVIRDSMAACVTPFLSLVASEVHTLDLRQHVVADPIVDSVYQYMEDFKPDYVMVIYSISEVDTPSAFEFD